jgi:hypothetical protein
MADSTAIKFYNPAEKFRPKSEASPSTSGRIDGEAAFDTVKADTVFFNGTSFYGAKDAETNAKSYTDTKTAALSEPVSYAYDASGDTYPAVGSGAAGAVAKNDTYMIGTVGTVDPFQYAGVGIIAKIDNPGQTAGNWAFTGRNFTYVPENAANKETSALDTSNTKYPCNNVVKTANDLKATDILAGYSAGAGTITNGDTVKEALQKADGNTALKATDIIAGYSKGAGTVANDDTLKAAIQKLDGNLDNKHGYYKDDTVEAGDWSGSGPYTLTIASATHGLTTVFGVHFWETSGTDKILRDSVSRKVDTNNAVIFSSDTALAGRAIVTGI